MKLKENIWADKYTREYADKNSDNSKRAVEINI